MRGKTSSLAVVLLSATLFRWWSCSGDEKADGNGDAKDGGGAAGSGTAGA